MFDVFDINGSGSFDAMDAVFLAGFMDAMEQDRRQQERLASEGVLPYLDAEDVEDEEGDLDLNWRLW